MRIGIDITPLQNGHRHRGVGEYARNLLPALAKTDRASDHEYYLFAYPGEPPELGEAGRFKLVQGGRLGKGGRWSRLLWHQVALPRLLRRHKIDLLHLLVQTYDTNIPLFRQSRMIVTVHDLKAMLFPELYLRDPKRRVTYALMIKLAKRADQIITDSLNSKKDITGKLGLVESKVNVVPLAVDPIFNPPVEKLKGNESRVLARYGLGPDFILFVGAIEPSKNVYGLLAAFEDLAKESHVVQLVLVGVKDPRCFQELENMFGHLFGGRVHFLDFIPKADLSELYGLAKMFVHPSLYEGFGLPILEAMAAGAPVVTSNVSSIPEVVGDAALLIDPKNQEELTAVVHKLYFDAKSRSELSKKGLEQAKRFSWNRCAAQTMAVYDRVGAASSRGVEIDVAS